jgi:hypothetical protein
VGKFGPRRSESISHRFHPYPRSNMAGVFVWTNDNGIRDGVITISRRILQIKQRGNGRDNVRHRWIDEVETKLLCEQQSCRAGYTLIQWVKGCSKQEKHCKKYVVALNLRNWYCRLGTWHSTDHQRVARSWDYSHCPPSLPDDLGTYESPVMFDGQSAPPWQNHANIPARPTFVHSEAINEVEGPSVPSPVPSTPMKP